MSTVLLFLVTLMPGQICCHVLAGGFSKREKVDKL